MLLGGVGSNCQVRPSSALVQNLVAHYLLDTRKTTLLIGNPARHREYVLYNRVKSEFQNRRGIKIYRISYLLICVRIS